MLAGLAAMAVAGVVVGTAVSSSSSASPDLVRAARSAHKSVDSSSSGYFRREVHLEDYPSVLEAVLTKSGKSSLDELKADEVAFYSYLPSSIVIEGDTDLIDPSSYAPMTETYNAFSLQCHGCDEGFGSLNYLIVMDMYGEVKGIYPHNETTTVDSLKPSPAQSKELYLGLNVDFHERGPVATWSWDGLDDDPMRYKGDKICNSYTVNAHDQHWSGYEDGDRIWVQLTTESKHTIQLLDKEGNQHVQLGVEDYPTSWGSLGSTNKFGLIEDETIMQVNLKYLGSFLQTERYSMDYSEEYVPAYIEWIAGGTEGTLDLVDLDGTKYEVGTEEYESLYGGLSSLWYGAHNLEYFGDNQFHLFDNAYYEENSTFAGAYSRMLIVEVDTEANTATLVWEYDMGYHSSVYGDNDRLPTTNLLGCGWPFEPEDTSTFDAEIIEVVRETGELAWSTRVYGNGRRTEYESSTGGGIYGWVMYSVERMYESPIISSPSCTESSTGATLSLTTFNNFKLSLTYAATYAVTTTDSDGTSVELASGPFEFNAYWKPTELTIDLDGSCGSDGCTVTITNKIGDASSTEFTCTAAS